MHLAQNLDSLIASYNIIGHCSKSPNGAKYPIKSATMAAMMYIKLELLPFFDDEEERVLMGRFRY